MSDTWVTNLSHFIDENGSLVGGPPGPIARHVARIVEAATTHPLGEPFHSAIRCRRRPGRVRCPGYILVRWTDGPPEVSWECHRCGDRGFTSGWEGTHWDRRRYREGEADQELIGVAIGPEHYDALRASPEHLVIDCPAVIAGAVFQDDMIILRGNASELDELQGYIAADANHTEDRRRQALFDEINEVIEAALQEHEDPL